MGNLAVEKRLQLKNGNSLFRVKGIVGSFHQSEQLADSCMISCKHFSFVRALAMRKLHLTVRCPSDLLSPLSQ